MKKIHRIVLILIFTPIFALTAFGSDRQGWSANDYWEYTQLDFKGLIRPILSNQNCKKSIKYFVACVSVLNQMHKKQKKDGLIILEAENHSRFEVVNSELDVLTYLKNLKLELVNQYSDSAISFIRVDFESVLSEFENEFLSSENDSMTAAQLYNNYLTVAVDPHSYIMPKEQMEDASGSEKKQKGIGVGLQRHVLNGVEKILIANVYEGSPAEVAGIEAGDIFLAVNGSDHFESMYERLTEDDSFNINILRNDNVIQIQVEKGFYKTRNVTHKVLYENNIAYGMVKLQSFSSNLACEEVKKAIVDMKSESNIQGLILDLRNNGGGLVSEAQCILSLFLVPGTKNWMVRNLGSETLVYDINKNQNNSRIFQNFHSVVLTNGYSASASEATAMYLQDYEKAFVVGERSFGKGSMQSVYELEDEAFGEDAKSVLKAQTTALYYGPKGVSPQVIGVEPDFEVFPKIDQENPTEYYREADRYAFPIEDRKIDRVQLLTEKRKQDLKLVKSCVDQKEDLYSIYRKMTTKEQNIFDHQLSKGLRVLDCAVHNVKLEQRVNIPEVSDFEMISRKQYQLRVLFEMQRERMRTDGPEIEIEIEIEPPSPSFEFRPEVEAPSVPSIDAQDENDDD